MHTLGDAFFAGGMLTIVVGVLLWLLIDVVRTTNEWRREDRERALRKIIQEELKHYGK